MLRKWIVGCAGFVTAVGVLMATPDSAWARRSRCCCQGNGYSYSGNTTYYSNSPQTYSGETATGTTYGTNYGPQGQYYDRNAGQGYYYDGRTGHHHNRGYGAGAYGVQGGVDVNGRPLPQNNNGVRADGAIRENDSIRPNDATRGIDRANPAPGTNRNDAGGRIDASGNARSSTKVTPPAPPAAPAAPAAPATPAPENDK
jgi:hypothetical protein